MPHKSVSRALMLAAWLLLPLGPALAASGDPIGTPVTISTPTEFKQNDPDIATTPDGRAVYAWGLGSVKYDDPDQIMARRMAADGSAVGGEFRVDTGNAIARYPQVATDAAGNFVVVWEGYAAKDVSGPVEGTGRVYLRRYSASGVPLSAPVLVDTNVAAGYDQLKPAIAMTAQGQFVVTWHTWRRYRYDAAWQLSEGPIMARRYAANGTPLSDPQLVAQRSSGMLMLHAPDFFVDVILSLEFSHDGPTVDIGPAGDFVVAWTSGSLVAPMFDNILLPTRLSLGTQSVQVQRFDAAGNKLGRPSQVQSLTSGRDTFVGPDVALAPDGGYALAWVQYQPWRLDPDNQRGTYLQRYDASGKTKGKATEVNRDRIPYSGLPGPRITVDANGNIIVVPPAAAPRLYASDGTALATAATGTFGGQFVPSIALHPNGDYQLTRPGTVVISPYPSYMENNFILSQRFKGP